MQIWPLCCASLQGVLANFWSAHSVIDFNIFMKHRYFYKTRQSIKFSDESQLRPILSFVKWASLEYILGSASPQSFGISQNGNGCLKLAHRSVISKVYDFPALWFILYKIRSPQKNLPLFSFNDMNINVIFSHTVYRPDSYTRRKLATTTMSKYMFW